VSSKGEVVGQIHTCRRLSSSKPRRTERTETWTPSRLPWPAGPTVHFEPESMCTRGVGTTRLLRDLCPSSWRQQSYRGSVRRPEVLLGIVSTWAGRRGEVKRRLLLRHATRACCGSPNCISITGTVQRGDVKARTQPCAFVLKYGV
jgi:hypothetical protein